MVQIGQLILSLPGQLQGEALAAVRAVRELVGAQRQVVVLGLRVLVLDAHPPLRRQRRCGLGQIYQHTHMKYERVCVIPHMEPSVIVVEASLARGGGIEGLWVGRCVVRG